MTARVVPSSPFSWWWVVDGTRHPRWTLQHFQKGHIEDIFTVEVGQWWKGQEKKDNKLYSGVGVEVNLLQFNTNEF